MNAWTVKWVFPKIPEILFRRNLVLSDPHLLILHVMNLYSFQYSWWVFVFFCCFVWVFVVVFGFFVFWPKENFPIVSLSEKLWNFETTLIVPLFPTGIILALLPEPSPIISPWGYTLFTRVMPLSPVCEGWAENRKMWGYIGSITPKDIRPQPSSPIQGWRKVIAWGLSTQVYKSVVVRFLETPAGK